MKERGGAIEVSASHKTAVDPTTDERAVANSDYEERVGKAWEADQEFSNALYMAYVAGELKLLRDYVAAGKPFQPDIPVDVGGELIPMHVLVAQLLGSQAQQETPRHGRPHRVPSAAPAIEQAERNAAWLVAFMLKSWREQNHRKRVPGAEVSKMISATITEAANAFHVPVNTIKECNIRTLLKNGSVVVL